MTVLGVDWRKHPRHEYQVPSAPSRFHHGVLVVTALRDVRCRRCGRFEVVDHEHRRTMGLSICGVLIQMSRFPASIRHVSDAGCSFLYKLFTRVFLGNYSMSFGHWFESREEN